MKSKTGYVFYDKDRKYWVARITWSEASGKRRERRAKVINKTEGRLLLKEWVTEIEEGSADKIIDGSRMNFRKLSEVYAEKKLIPAVIKGTERVAGMKTYKTQKGFLRALVEYFGNKKIASITRTDLEEFKEQRLQEKTYRGNERSLAHVNRELTLMRMIMNYAVGKGWLKVSPFVKGNSKGKPLISHAGEPKRERILNVNEETRLLAACTGRRTHLRPILICLIDTGLRKGEMMALRWTDVSLDAGLITVRPETNKVLRGRVVGISARLRGELLQLLEIASVLDGFVFPQGDFKRAFYSACKEAGIIDLRAHDLRHTALSRLIRAGTPIAETMCIGGHSTLNIAYRYMNVDEETARRVAETLDNFYANVVEAETASDFVN
ncbi:MAG: site-specific integrase [Acidobacteria bacterium]|nr:site-specific integrase [Acidobacteriota bacterium]